MLCSCNGQPTKSADELSADELSADEISLGSGDDFTSADEIVPMSSSISKPMVHPAMQRSLARAIFREARQLRKQGPGAGFQLPAIYDVCNSVNPNSGGILLGNQEAYRNFVKSYFEQWCIAQELGEHSKLRKLLPAVMGDRPAVMVEAEEGNSSSSVKLSADFFSKPSFIQFEKRAEARCPFEVLRAFKFQNSMSEASSKTECHGISLSAVTGYAREMSAPNYPAQESTSAAETIQAQDDPSPIWTRDVVPAAPGPKENIFSYNILFANKSRRAVRILGHQVVFKHKGTELKRESYQGVNNTLPVISPGGHYVCGATVAFPAELTGTMDSYPGDLLTNRGGTDITVGGSFDIIEEGAKSPEFELLPLEKKWNVLNSFLEHGNGNSFTAELQDTKFSFDVVCDTQPLAEKFRVAEPTVEELDAQY